MPVISQFNKSILHEDAELQDFWNNKQLNFAVSDRTKIISVARKIPLIDPLACLQKFTTPDTLHFYWENPSKQEAMAAWGVAKSTRAQSASRFAVAQNFIKNCFQQIIKQSDHNLAESNPSIFCSFTFFSQQKQEDIFSSGTLFLPRFQIAKKNKTCWLIINFPLAESQDKKNIRERLEKSIKIIDWRELEKLEISSDRDTFAIPSTETKNSDYFKSVVTSALNSIAVDEFSKIVIAHTTDIQSSEPFQLIASLNNLRKIHPDCYIFSTSNGKGQNFIGASPERLISIQNKQLVSDALAGSAPRGKTTSEDAHLASLLLKSRKEKREHQAVSDFIMERLRSLGLKPQQLPLQLLKLSSIQHLWTPIYAHLPGDIEPLEIIEQLHPTPAVAGVPTAIVCNKIRDYEQFDRSLYAAPLGWIDSQGNCEFVVGIRSALIDGNCARLYAGAGIVSGSNPNKEFAEVQLKLQSLIDALV
ncbi:MAG: isochorismate synthase MenF [Pleurocapsa sp.]